MYRKPFNGRSYGRNHGRKAFSSTIHESKFVKRTAESIQPATFVPTMAFADLNIHPLIKQNIANRGYTQPTAIQDAAILPILEGRDVIGLANTGTGKTATFLIPLLNKAMNDKNAKILVIVPTRELAVQIREEMSDLAQSLPINAALCIGGAPMFAQIRDLMRRPQFVIGTPGRLKDLAEKRILKLPEFNTIVLDEVDRMLDMGFIHDIRSLISFLPPVKQSLFFSATLSQEINMLIQQLVKDPVKISVKTQDTTANVDQDIIRVGQGKMKIDILSDLLNKEEFKKVLIFGRTKMGVERLSRTLFQKGFKVTSIHGDKPQVKRNQAIRLFEKNVVDILVATDVASRGIDISDITHVINYDQPATYEDYIHRIGRTGRANKKGIALTFVD
jgi:superfamily II DNA/RNA helicase